MPDRVKDVLDVAGGLDVGEFGASLHRLSVGRRRLFLLAALADHAADELSEIGRVDRRPLEVLAGQRAEVPPRVDLEFGGVGVAPPVCFREGDHHLLFPAVGKLVDERECVEPCPARREPRGEIVHLNEPPRFRVDLTRLRVAHIVEVEEYRPSLVGFDVGDAIRKPKSRKFRRPLASGLEGRPHIGVVVANVPTRVIGIDPRRTGNLPWRILVRGFLGEPRLGSKTRRVDIAFVDRRRREAIPHRRYLPLSRTE